MKQRRRHRRGFTLLELLMAITIGAMLMVAASTFVFSMGELWGRGTDERLFDRHVRGVSRQRRRADRGDLVGGTTRQ